MCLYKALFPPHLNCCNIIWGSWTEGLVCNVSILELEYLCTVNQIHEKQLMILMYKCHYDLLPAGLPVVTSLDKEILLTGIPELAIIQQCNLGNTRLYSM